MTDLYRVTWQKKDDNAPVIAGPVLIHRKENPYWAKAAAPYTHEEALAACKRWNWFCPGSTHKVILVTTQKEETYNEIYTGE